MIGRRLCTHVNKQRPKWFKNRFKVSVRVAQIFNPLLTVFFSCLRRDSLIKWFVRLQLSDYEVMYHDSLEVAWLDKVRVPSSSGRSVSQLPPISLQTFFFPPSSLQTSFPLSHSKLSSFPPARSKLHSPYLAPNFLLSPQLAPNFIPPMLL